nr:MAG: hypothetical protein [Bacteriophage sp.]UVX78470.1 MAG: hypothetical protein [Bacteriophage sp.]
MISIYLLFNDYIVPAIFNILYSGTIKSILYVYLAQARFWYDIVIPFRWDHFRDLREMIL